MSLSGVGPSVCEGRFSVTTPPHMPPGLAEEQLRLVIETLVEVVPGTEIVAVVAPPSGAIPGFEPASFAAPGSESALARIHERVLGQLGDNGAIASFSCVVSGVAWGVVVEPIELQGGTVAGALVG